MIAVSCPAPFGQGGLGRHLAELVEEVRATGRPVRYYATAAPDGEAVRSRWLPWVFRYTPVRFRKDWQMFLQWAAFDRAVAGRLPPGRSVHAFAGAALHTFRKARALGYAEYHLESPTGHVGHARRSYDGANRAHPIERDWLGPRLLARTLAEYELADAIWVNSEYARGTFLAAGVPAGKLRRRTLTVDSRFRPPAKPPENSGLHAVYVGALSVAKGVPVLLEAFARLADPRARLTLVGGSGSRGMRRYLDEAIRRDPRVQLAPGDPLPHLHAADVCVHPSHHDGFGYGPAEALACAVLVIVTADTGMKELVREGETGWVVPTGDPDALFARLEALAAKDRQDRRA